MFTGIIEGLGTIAGIHSRGKGSRFAVDSDFVLKGTAIGDSLAVNGACLTAVEVKGKRFEVDVSPETLSVTNLGKAKIGERVNIERALRFSDRLDGHIVSGHIDGIGTIKDFKTIGNYKIISISVPESIARYLIHKGSVAVDGISLTINECRKDGFDVSIIPHTGGLTTIGFKNIGDSVNIETDLIGKYVEQFLKQGSNKSESTEKQKIDMAFLAKTGFMD